jgi:hypothetical protein
MFGLQCSAIPVRLLSRVTNHESPITAFE